MPIYEFECRKCKHVFSELFIGSRRVKKPVCPACGAKRVERVFSPFASGSSAKGGGGGKSKCGGCTSHKCSGCH